MERQLKHFRELYPLWERLKYLRWYLSRERTPITLRMNDGTVISMRPKPLMDHHIAYEVMFQQSYALPALANPRTVMRIVDVGSHVGISCLYWAKKFPSAHIEAFEPHPVHARLLRKHLEMNRLGHRVTLHEVAAGTRSRSDFLLDSDVNSRVVGEDLSEPKGYEVQTVDFFATIGRDQIDVLKLDIEGAEYSLMDDPRFAELQIRHLVMEWHHNRSFQGAGSDWCRSRLANVGFLVEDKSDPKSQIIRARRDPSIVSR